MIWKDFIFGFFAGGFFMAGLYWYLGWMDQKELERENEFEREEKMRRRRK